MKEITIKISFYLNSIKHFPFPHPQKRESEKKNYGKKFYGCNHSLSNGNKTFMKMDVSIYVALSPFVFYFHGWTLLILGKKFYRFLNGKICLNLSKKSNSFTLTLKNI